MRIRILFLILLLCGGAYAQRTPTTPTNMRSSATLGVNVVKFDGVRLRRGIFYEVWRLYGDTVDWYLWQTTESNVLLDVDTQPGQYYQYRVRACTASGCSNFSNTTMLYNWGE